MVTFALIVNLTFNLHILVIGYAHRLSEENIWLTCLWTAFIVQFQYVDQNLAQYLNLIGDISITKWALAWDFQQYDILKCIDSDEPLQLPFKLINSKWCSVSSLIFIEHSSD